MNIRVCPSCEKVAARHLGGISGFVIVDYYRCAECGHICASHRDGETVFENNIVTVPQRQKISRASS